MGTSIGEVPIYLTRGYFIFTYNIIHLKCNHCIPWYGYHSQAVFYFSRARIITEDGSAYRRIHRLQVFMSSALSRGKSVSAENPMWLFEAWDAIKASPQPAPSSASNSAPHHHHRHTAMSADLHRYGSQICHTNSNGCDCL